MKCLVTGGAGFIGSNLVKRLLKRGHQVIVLDNLSTGRISNLNSVRKKIKFVKIDISKSTKSIKKYFKNIDWVFHLAGLADILPSINNPNSYFKANVEGTQNILQALKNIKIKKLIYSASASCYGIPKKYPTNENAKINPQNPYAITKYIGEQLVINWAKLYKMPNISLRFFNAYGPNSRKKGPYGSVFSVFLAQRIKKKPLTIIGDGNQTRDFIHVFDLIDIMIKAANSNRIGEIYNVGSGKETSINSVANIIGGKKVYLPKRPGEPDQSLADITKIKRHLNYKSKISIREGVEMLLEDISDWKSAHVWTSESIKKNTKKLYKKN
tara:strand:+ start:223 stop:1200 length:978 start_codon:yes stop_codon:yes gene_type:complete